MCRLAMTTILLIQMLTNYIPLWNSKNATEIKNDSLEPGDSLFLPQLKRINSQNNTASTASSKLPVPMAVLMSRGAVVDEAIAAIAVVRLMRL